jgi:hypothetical protein
MGTVSDPTGPSRWWRSTNDPGLFSRYIVAYIKFPVNGRVHASDGGRDGFQCKSSDKLRMLVSNGPGFGIVQSAKRRVDNLSLTFRLADSV